MNDNQWKNIIDGFQKKGGFEISDEQQELWKEMYFNKRVDAIVKSFKGFLMERKDHRTPQPGQLYPLYKNACIEIDRHAKANESPISTTPKVPMEEVKKISSSMNQDVWPQVITRAHNLCRRWRGFMGYDSYGRVISESSFGKFADVLDAAIRAQYGDPKEVVEKEAVIQSVKYKEIEVPDHLLRGAQCST